MLALINLALLTGHVGRYGSGLNPLRGQNNVQGGGDMGAIPNKLPGFQDIEKDADARERFGAAWGTTIDPALRLAPDPDVRGDGARRAAHPVRDRREPGPVRGRPGSSARRLLSGLDFLVVQDLYLTKTAELADVVLPGAAGVGGVQRHGDQLRAPRAARAQGARSARRCPRRHLGLTELARRLGHDWGEPAAERIWDELRS